MRFYDGSVHFLNDMLYGRLLVITFLLFAENAAGQINTAIKWDSAAYYFRKSDFQNSLRCLDDLIALQPAHADAYIWKADIYGQLKITRNELKRSHCT